VHAVFEIIEDLKAIGDHERTIVTGNAVTVYYNPKIPQYQKEFMKVQFMLL